MMLAAILFIVVVSSLSCLETQLGDRWFPDFAQKITSNRERAQTEGVIGLIKSVEFSLMLRAGPASGGI
jgi:hypothetical protein